MKMISKWLAQWVAIVLLLGLFSVRVPAQEEPQKRTLLELPAQSRSWSHPAQFSRDGRLFAILFHAEGTTTFRALNVNSSETIASWKLRYLTQFALSPDGRSVATISGGRQRYGIGYGFAVEVRDLRTGAKQRTLVPTGSINSAFYALAWSADGSKIAVGGGDGRVRVFDLRTGQQQTLLASGEFIRVLAFSDDGRFLAAGGNTLHLWTLRTGRVTRPRPSEKLSQTLGLTFSRDGKRLLTRRAFYSVNGSNPGTVIYALPSLKPIRLLEPLPADSEDISQQIALSSRGDNFAFAGAINISLGNTKSGQIIKRLQFSPDRNSTESVLALFLSPDSVLRWVTATDYNNNYRVSLWSVR